MASSVTAFFYYSNQDKRSNEPADIFNGLAKTSDKPTPQSVSGGLLHPRGFKRSDSGVTEFRTLRLLNQNPDGSETLYDIDGSLKFTQVDNESDAKWTKKGVAIPENVITIDEASILYID